MELWLDSTKVELIKKVQQLGFLFGVTTNPTLIAKAGKDILEILEDILHSLNGPVAAQVDHDEAEAMIEQAHSFQSISKRIVIKIPVTKEGLKAIHQLSRQNIPTMATVIFHPNQALLAAMAGANYAAPYISRMDNPMALLASMMRIYGNYRFETKILGASIKDVEQMRQCAEMGLPAMTLKEEVFNHLIEDNESTLQCLAKFSADSKSLLISH